MLILHRYTAIRTYTAAAGLLFLVTGGWDCKGPAHPDAVGSAPVYLHGASYQNTTGQWKMVRLADSTDVLVNDKTMLSVTDSFNKSNRELQLDGEAVFQVNGDAGKPFVVRTRNLQIIVLGTRFRVDAHSESPGEEVDLLSGKLKVMKSYHSTTDNEPEILQAGEMVMINRDIDLMEKEKLDSAELANLQRLH